jgi:hypothetical protein
VRLTLSRGDEPLEFRIIHTDLYFFFDIDIAILALEVAADDLELSVAQEALFRFGRAYPAYWEGDRRGGHCPWLVEWLSPKGEVLACSDYEKREKYLSFVSSIALRPWLHIGSICSRRWFFTTATGKASSATGSSNTTACPTWCSSPWRTPTRSRDQI